MAIWQVLKECLQLLGRRDRWKLVISTIIQMATSLLDLIGVLLLGLFGVVAVATVQGQGLPSISERLLTALGLAPAPLTQVLVVLGVVASGVLVTKSILSSYLLRRVFLFLASRQAMVAGKLASGLLSQPIVFLQRRSSQETSFALVQGASAATLLVLGQAIVAVTEFSLLFVLTVTLLVVSPIVAIGTLVFFGSVAVLLHFALGRWSASAGESVVSSDIASLGAVQEVHSAYREVSVLERRDYYVNVLMSQRWQAAKGAADLQFVSILPKYILEFALVVGSLSLAVYLFSTEGIAEAVGTLTVFLATTSRIVPSILRMQSALLGIRNASAMAQPALDLHLELLRATDQHIDHVGDTSTNFHQHDALEAPLSTSGIVPSVETSRLSFYYDEHKPVLQDISIRVPAGSLTAIVGPSGAGKSTLADVILGVLEPTSGRVRIGGVPPRDATMRWPGAIAYVAQDSFVANASVRQNVALGMPDEEVNDESIWKALELARLADVISDRPEGLDTLVGERGVRLSGGQRQRLGIARALYTSPQLIVLDEATSAMDSETEMAITSAFTSLRGSVTLVVIAHRLSTVRDADQVIYLTRGRVVASGPMDQVRRTVPAFDRQANLMGLT